MAAMNCPRCGAEMQERTIGQAEVSQCPERHGVFLSRAELGALVESEIDWRRGSSAQTAPLPKITSDMAAPPAARKRTRAFVETLFG